jgi:hypothetical protein
MSDARSWPTDNHYRLLRDGTLEQWDNLYAFLPSVQTEDQDYFMRKLATKIREAREHGT